MRRQPRYLQKKMIRDPVLPKGRVLEGKINNFAPDFYGKI